MIYLNVFTRANFSVTVTVTVPYESASGNLRVALAMAPMRTEGMAMMIQPKAATYDRICALPADLLESTLWKYTCNSIERTCCMLHVHYVVMS